MSHSAQIYLVGFGMIGLGLFFIICRSEYSKKMAAHMRDAWWAARTKWDYSEEYFRSLYLFGGIFSIAAGLLAIICTFLGGPEHEPNSIAETAISVYVMALFGFGGLYIAYTIHRFGKRKNR